MDLKDLECLVALSRCRHFARAAQECGLSQPAFSMRIRNLEKMLDTIVVKRGNRFQQLTPEGEQVLAHARTILDRVNVLQAEIRTGRGELSGSLVIGAIPTAVAHAARAAIWLKERHPGIRTRIVSASSIAILQGIEDGKFDAGITYSEGVSDDLVTADEITTEEYVLVAPKTMVAESAGEITWAETAELPLTLLEPEMQNRRIIDRIFEDVGVSPQVAFESNGFNAAIIIALSGVAAAVVPKILIEELDSQTGVEVLPLIDPVVEKSISLVTPRHSGGRARTQAFREVVLERFQ